MKETKGSSYKVLINENLRYLSASMTLGEGHIMESMLQHHREFPIQLQGWNKTYKEPLTLTSCYEECIKTTCQMFYHTNYKKCVIFEKLFTDFEQMRKAPRKDSFLDTEEFLNIYWLRP